MKEILDRILPEGSSDRYWLCFWFVVGQVACVGFVALAVALSIKSYQDRNRPTVTQEQIIEAVQGMRFHVTPDSK